MKLITFIYGFRDREVLRVRLSLDSLRAQTHKGFEVVFVDYGSSPEVADEVSRVVSEYEFVRYVYCDTYCMEWNRSHALNVAVKASQTDFVFTSDIDMIFDPGFVGKLYQVADSSKAIFFSAVMLPPDTMPGQVQDPEKYHRKMPTALGWGLLPSDALRRIGSYDEFYCIWGKEDNDIAHRLEMSGCRFTYIEEIWMYHYYHPPVPDQREVLPADWYRYLSDYFESTRQEMVRNTSGWGRLIQSSDRSARKALYDTAVRFTKCSSLSRFFRYTLENLLRNARSGELIAVEYTSSRAGMYENSRASRFALALNSVVSRLGLPFTVHNKFEMESEDKYAARDELFYFLHSCKHQFSDYAYEISGSKIKVVYTVK